MTLREELEAEQVRHLDLQRYCQVESGTTVREAVARMRAAGGGTALITRDSELIGIFTERDALRRVAGEPETLDRPVDEVMTARPITVLPDTSAADALWLMDDHHFRNLPVIDRTEHAKATGVTKGAYVLVDAASGSPDVILVATGSEVSLALAARLETSP